ncbi:MAG: hypothetical protein U9O97_00825 [Elusimicrobiota bacterium]|nr:hypothetical protein [Elusimicrobiota bacterium]
MKLKILTHRALKDIVRRVCFMFLLGAAVFSGAPSSASETSFLQMLFVPADPLSLSMGGANASVPGTASFLINPSHAAGVTRPSFGAGTVLWWEDISLRSVAAYFPVNAAFTAGFYSMTSDYGNIDAYSALDAPMGSVEAGDSFWAAGAGYRLSRGRLGAAFVSMSQTLSAENEGSAAALLCGAEYKMWFLNTGFSYLQPLGEMDFGGGTSTQEIPSIMRIGANCSIRGSCFTGAFTLPSAGAAVQSLGIEIPVWGVLKCRAGMNTVDSVMGFSAGLGLKYDRFSFDYGFCSAEFGDAVHAFSFSARLGYSTLKSRLYRKAKSFFKQGFYEKSLRTLNEVLILDPGHTKAKILSAKIAKIISRLENPSTKE